MDLRICWRLQICPGFFILLACYFKILRVLRVEKKRFILPAWTTEWMTVFIFCEPDINCYNQTFPSAQMVTDHEERTIRVTDRPKVFAANETCLIANHHSQFLQILILISIKNVLESILGVFRNVSWIDVFCDKISWFAWTMIIIPTAREWCYLSIS